MVLTWIIPRQGTDHLGSGKPSTDTNVTVAVTLTWLGANPTLSPWGCWALGDCEAEDPITKRPRPLGASACSRGPKGSQSHTGAAPTEDNGLFLICPAKVPPLGTLWKPGAQAPKAKVPGSERPGSSPVPGAAEATPSTLQLPQSPLGPVGPHAWGSSSCEPLTPGLSAWWIPGP